MSKFTVAIVGATGAVGLELMELLVQRAFPLGSLRLLASARSAGKNMTFGSQELLVKELKPDSFAGVDLALFSAGGSISREFAPHAAAAGALVIDNSSAFRLDPEVPLCVPEINAAQITQATKGIIANPNCTTIIACMALAPLHQRFGLQRVVASSYQAVSGSGAAGIAELEGQMNAFVAKQELPREVYPKQILSNCLPMIGDLTENGYTDEEMKMQNEGRKILDIADLHASATCVRVPVYRSHAVSLSAQFARQPTVEEAREAIAEFAGVGLMDGQGEFPTPLDCSGQDDCLVGRIRPDLAWERALNLWVVGDQVRKGAALNAVQIAEAWVEQGFA